MSIKKSLNNNILIASIFIFTVCFLNITYSQNIHVIEGDFKDKKISIEVENCELKTTLKSVTTID